MKALILAAGFGTRLKPYSDKTPKSLFPIAGRPNLDIIIRRLEDAGCDAAVINTHHLHHKIDRFLSSQRYSIPVYTKYEPEILGTGGAIKNFTDFWDSRPFFVINSDVVTDIDLKMVYNFHLGHHFPATLVLYDDPEFNKVTVDKNNFIVDFSCQSPLLKTENTRNLTFTGIQVLDPVVLDFIPEGQLFGSIDAYTQMIRKGLKIRALRYHHYWKDIGTPERYQEAVYDKMAPISFQKAYPEYNAGHIDRIQLKGDGSDRTWYRLKASECSLIMADHGIRQPETTSEIDAFVSIGRHLYDKKLPVPKIYLYDLFSGLVFLEDLGETSLQAVVQQPKGQNQITAVYETVIDQLIKLSIEGAKNFNPSWTCQTTHYDKSLILEKECRYFVDAFLNRYLGMNIYFNDLEEEFKRLADSALEYASLGFMHRDMQSRNIMIKNNLCYFIDFQGGRIGPLQYDLASLLIDPYVELPYSFQTHLLNHCYERLSAYRRVEQKVFYSCYTSCAITRNLQILGAFGFLSRQKGKPHFERYIPPAVKTLKHNLSNIKNLNLSALTSIVSKLGSSPI